MRSRKDRARRAPVSRSTHRRSLERGGRLALQVDHSLVPSVDGERGAQEQRQHACAQQLRIADRPVRVQKLSPSGCRQQAPEQRQVDRGVPRQMSIQSITPAAPQSSSTSRCRMCRSPRTSAEASGAPGSRAASSTSRTLAGARHSPSRSTSPIRSAARGTRSAMSPRPIGSLDSSQAGSTVAAVSLSCSARRKVASGRASRPMVGVTACGVRRFRSRDQRRAKKRPPVALGGPAKEDRHRNRQRREPRQQRHLALDPGDNRLPAREPGHPAAVDKPHGVIPALRKQAQLRRLERLELAAINRYARSQSTTTTALHSCTAPAYRRR